MMVSDPKYQNHAVFSQLERHIAFYRDLAQSVFHWMTMGTKAICSIDSYVFSSIQGTLASIRTILGDGRINDAYALLRKYYDSVTINIYSNLYLQDHFSIENLVVEQIDNWLKGKAQLPEYRIMSQYIRSSLKTEPITALVFAEDRYKRLRDRCNDHTHYNFYRNVLLNDNEIDLPDRLHALDQFSTDVRDVLILHVAYIFFINENYMMSSDHLDYLECGMTPEPHSQYWVAPFIQDVFNQVVAKHRPDIAETVKKHTSMHLA
ncbi:MAG: hypothetical protein JSU86_07685 [Phycisphaerales bacterium]|nr:MAG: hypothetical protein JSU86_07685 [Phycisphaerales bacterium]